MVPPSAMQTTKKRGGFGLLVLVLLMGLLAGCTPPGARALLDGKRLLEAGDPTNAVEQLQLATTLLPTNAPAWNYLGLAYHHSGQVTNAAQAYQRALTLNPDLSEARFNLGCLWFEQNRFEPAKVAFTAYTLRRPQELQGWLKLGLAQLYTREAAAAERSFNEALRLSPKESQACNGLGLAALQRNRTLDAVHWFNRALEATPTFRPALLNLAITLQHNPATRPQALERYREYLTLVPRAADWEAVNGAALALKQELARAANPPPTNAVTPSPSAPPVVAKSVTNPAVAPPTVTKADAPTNVAKPAPAVVAKPTPPPPTQTVEVVTPPPEIKVTEDAPPVIASHSPGSPLAVEITTNQTSAPPQPAKRTFVQRMNPLNLFKRTPKPEPRPTPLRSGAQPASVTTAIAPTAEPTAAASPPPKKDAVAVRPATKPIPRYSYHAFRKPASGNRQEAERSFALGVQAQGAGRLTEAIQAFQAATRADPAYFEAYYYLGFAAAQAGSLSRSLVAYESALAVDPDSVDARYNFALGLKQAGFWLDAANELERILTLHAIETRAHLALANLYADQLRQPARARAHYNQVLLLEPRHPQAFDIRRWLVQHPG